MLKRGRIILLALLMMLPLGCSSSTVAVDQYVGFNDLRIYHIYVSTFVDTDNSGYTLGYGEGVPNGDLNGIRENLEYISDLGMNAILLTPVFESLESDDYDDFEERGRATGYYADDYYEIDPNFGTIREFKKLVDEAHDLGLYVFMDGVFGHHGSYEIYGVEDGESQWYGYETVYPQSLDYFTGVASYYVEQFKIDGWRLDQSYQLIQDGVNYAKDIREAVESAAKVNEENGEEWGTLGYVVAEIWDTNGSQIQSDAYDDEALFSAFNFPARYNLVALLAQDDDGNKLSSFSMLNSSVESEEDIYPNLFITNHDLIRFGDLIQMADKDEYYWQLHKLAISYLASYTGPVTLFYGDEYGLQSDLLTEGVYELADYDTIAKDNVARLNAQTNNYSPEQLDLIDYTSKVMNLKADHNALYNGETTIINDDQKVLVMLKESESESIIYVMNLTEETYICEEEQLQGNLYTNLLTNSSESVIEVEAMSSGFYLVK